MDNTILDPSLFSIKAILILDNDGRRMVAKYFDSTFPSVKEQKAFESNLFQKTQKANAEILMLDGLTCVYRSNVDLYFYVIGSSLENELMLSLTLSTLYEAVALLLRKNVEKSVLLDNVDQVFLLVDELCDNGVLLESDPQTLVQRVSIRHDDVPLNEQTVAQVIQTAKEQLKWSLLK